MKEIYKYDADLFEASTKKYVILCPTVLPMDSITGSS